MDDKDVIEVEVLSETASEAKVDDTPKKNVTYLSRSDRGRRLLGISSAISRFASPLTFLFAAGGLTFSILFSQGGGTAMLVLLSICWVGSLASLLAWIISFILGMRAKRLLEDEEGGE